METRQTVTANLVALNDCQRISQRFIQEAIAEWDLIGMGCFVQWILTVTAKKWKEMAQRN